MKKSFVRKLSSLVLSFAMGLGVAVGAISTKKESEVKAASASYSLVFNVGTNDGSSVSTSTAASTVLSSGSDYVTGNLATATKVYNSGSGGLKLGTSSDSGTVKFTLSDAGKVKATSIVVSAKRYSSSKATNIKVNGSANQGLSADFSDYTFNITGNISYIEIVSSKGTSGGAYCWIASVTVNYEVVSAKTVSSIAVSGTASKTSYFIGDSFDFSGLTATATYTDNTTGDITSLVQWSSSPSTISSDTKSVSVTASYSNVTSNSFTVNGIVATEKPSLAGNYTLFSGDLEEGYYLIGQGSSGQSTLMQATISSDRFGYNSFTISNNSISISEDDLSYVWMISSAGDGKWTIYNESVSKYAAGTGAKNKAQLSDDGTSDMSKWTSSGTSAYEFVNVKNTANSVNANLRYNAGYGFACYATGTGSSLSLFKLEEAKTISSIAVKTAPTKVTYETGEDFNPSGLVITVTYEGNSTKDISYSDSNKNDFSFNPSTNLSQGTSSVTITYKGKTCSQAITVNAAKVLTGITIGGDLSKKAFVVGDSFSKEGLTVTASYDDTSSKDVTSSSEITFSPAAPTLGSTSVVVTASYLGKTATKTVAITVEAKPGSADKPFTVAQAIEEIERTGHSNTEFYYVTGIITQIDSYSGQYKSITYWINDTNSTDGQFEVYSGKNLNNTEFTSVDELELGMVVTVYGNIKKYVPKTGPAVYEFDKNNYITNIYIAPVSSISVETQPTNKTYYVGESFNSTGMVVKATYEDNSTKTVTGPFTFEPETLASDTTSVTVKYTEGEKTVSTSVTGIDVLTLSKITLESQTTSFRSGQAFSLGGSVYPWYTHSSGAAESKGAALAANAYTVNKSGTLTLADNGAEVTVSYQGKEAKYNISVGNAFVTGVKMDSEKQASVTNTIELTASVSPAEADQSVTFSIDTANTTLKNSEYTLSGSILTIGDTVDEVDGVIVVIATSVDVDSAGGHKTASCTIHVATSRIPVLTSVTVGGTPTYATQYVGHEFNPAGLTFTPVYDIKNEEPVAITGSDIEWNDLVAGEPVTGVYHDTNDITVTVSSVTVLADNLKSISIEGDLSTKAYFTNDEAFDFTGLSVSGDMDSGDAATIKQEDVVYETDLTPEEYYLSEASSLTVTATYGGKTDTKVISGVTVNLFKVSTIEVTTAKTSYTLGEEFTSEGLVVKATYSDGSTDTDFKGYSIDSSKINKFAEGTYTVGLGCEGTEGTSFNVTYSKLIEQKGFDYYELVTNTNDLKDGDQLIVVGIVTKDNVTTYYGMEPFVSGNNNCRTVAMSGPTNGKFSIDDIKTSAVITLSGQSGSWSLFDGTYYLCASGGDAKNYFVGTSVNTSDTTKYTISVAETGVATIKTIDSSTSKNTLRFNSTNSPMLFSCYSGGQSDVYLYKHISQEAITGSVISISASCSASNLVEGGKLSISDLTVNGYYNTDKTEAITSGVTFSDGTTEKTLVAGTNNFTVKYVVGEQTFTANVSVTAREKIKVTGITVTGAEGALFEGQTKQLTASVTPNNADDPSFIWSSSDANVATVSSSGLVTAKAVNADGQTATITATANDGSGVTGTFVVTVNKDDVTGIVLVSSPTKVSYTYGDKFSAAGLKIKEVYESGKFGEEIAYDSSTFTLGIADGATLDHTMTSCYVSYGGHSLASPIAITVDKVAQSLSVTGYNPTVYEGQEYDIGDDYTATITYSDETTATTSIADKDVLVDTSTPGIKVVRVEAAKLTATFQIEVLKDEVKTISLLNGAGQTVYSHGETFNPEGICVTIGYASGKSEDVYYDDPRLSYNLSTLNEDGVHALAITYGDKLTLNNAQQITVNRIATDVSISSQDVYKDYNKDNPGTPYSGDIYQTDKITVLVHTITNYTSGEPTTETTEVAFGALAAGINNKDITVNGKTVTVSLTNVKAVELTKVDLDLQNVTLTGYIEGQTFVKDGIVVNAVYNNGITSAVSADKYTIVGPEKLAVGNNTFTVSFDANGDGTISNNEKTTFVIAAAEKQISNIEFVGTQAETHFFESELTDLVANGYQLKVNYNNGTNEVIDITKAMVSIDNGVVTVTYGEKTLTYNITVLNMDNIDSITLENSSIAVTKDSELVFNPGQVTAHYAGTEKTLVLDPSTYMVDAVSTSAIGDTTYYVTVTGTEVKAPFTVSVNYGNVESVTITGNGDAPYAPNVTVDLDATINPTNAGQGVTWSTNNEAVATVNANGVVTFKAEGSVVITATSTQDPTKSASVTLVCEIPVIHVEGITLNTDAKTLDVNGTFKIEATVTPANADDKTVTFSSSNEAVATVNANGVVTAKAEGTAVITVTTADGEKTATCTITVNAPVNEFDNVDPGVEVFVDTVLGCFGSVGATSALVSIATLLGAGLALSKKRRKEDK